MPPRATRTTGAPPVITPDTDRVLPVALNNEDNDVVHGYLRSYTTLASSVHTTSRLLHHFSTRQTLHHPPLRVVLVAHPLTSYPAYA